jgi:hypothetical protein
VILRANSLEHKGLVEDGRVKMIIAFLTLLEVVNSLVDEVSLISDVNVFLFRLSLES